MFLCFPNLAYLLLFSPAVNLGHLSRFLLNYHSPQLAYISLEFALPLSIILLNTNFIISSYWVTVYTALIPFYVFKSSRLPRPSNLPIPWLSNSCWRSFHAFFLSGCFDQYCKNSTRKNSEWLLLTHLLSMMSSEMSRGPLYLMLAK